MLKKFYIFIILFFSIFFGNNLLAQEKIAFVDLNYVYMNSKIGKKMSQEIETKQKKISKEFNEFQKKLDEEKENLMKQKNVLAEEEFKKKISDLENNLKKYSQVIAKKNKDLLDFRNKSKEQFANTLKSTLEKFAKENSISMILRKEQILIGKTNLDITKEILDLFNKN